MGEPTGEEGFKVTDRRRLGTGEEPSPTGRSDQQGREPEPRRAERPRPEPPPPRAAEPATAAPGAERSLVGLFMMLGSSALMALGEVPDPVTGQRHPDLEQAAEVIDLLLLLREKTEGRRDPQESQVLDELVYDLQLRYVNATRRLGR